MAEAPKPTSMTRAKEWSPEAEEAWRFQVAGYRDELEYKNVKQNEVSQQTELSECRPVSLSLCFRYMYIQNWQFSR